MKFKFSLEKVLAHRKVVENLAQKDFQEALANYSQEEKKLHSMENQISVAHTRVDSLVKQGGHPGPALVQIDEFIKGQKVLIEIQKEKLQSLEKLVEDKREILRQAALDYKIMEKMRENKFAEYRETRLKNDQKEMDEQAILRFKSVKES